MPFRDSAATGGERYKVRSKHAHHNTPVHDAGNARSPPPMRRDQYGRSSNNLRNSPVYSGSSFRCVSAWDGLQRTARVRISLARVLDIHNRRNSHFRGWSIAIDKSLTNDGRTIPRDPTRCSHRGNQVPVLATFGRSSFPGLLCSVKEHGEDVAEGLKGQEQEMTTDGLLNTTLMNDFPKNG